MSEQPEFALTPITFSRASKRGVLFGLSEAQLVTAGLALGVIVVALYGGGAGAVVWSSPVWAALAALTWVPVGGRVAVSWLPLSAHWLVRRAARQTRYRRRVTRPRPVGSLALPGDAASLRMHEDPDSGAVMVHDPHAATLTVVVEVTHPAFVLLDPVDQHRRVQAWGRVLASACRSPHIARLQVLERALPDSGTGLADWWARHGHDDGSWVARVYTELVERAGPAGERHVTTVSLALDMRAAARSIRAAGGGLRGAAAVLRREMTSLVAALRAAELHPGRWLDAPRLAEMLRVAYDPHLPPVREANLATSGPVAVDEWWGKLRTDSAWHAVLWISDWPRAQVLPGFLAPVVLSSGIRRAVTVLYDPIGAEQAARTIRKLRTEYVSDAAQRAKAGQIDDAQQSAEYRDVLRQEADLVAGHGILRHTGLIAVSADSEAELDAAVAAMRQAASQASLETRLLVGQQAAAFAAAALPLCRGV
jgi:hypothetical protein